MNTVVEGTGVTNQRSLEICMNYHEVLVDPIPSQVYGAQINLDCATRVKNFSNVRFHAGQSVELDPGFEVEKGAIFLGEIEPCSN